MDTSTRFAQLIGAADSCITQFGIGSHGPLTGDDSFKTGKATGHGAQGAKRIPRNRAARQDHDGATPSPAYATTAEFSQRGAGSVVDLIELADGVLASHEFEGYGGMPESLADYKRKKKRKDTTKGAVAGAAVGAGGVVAARRAYQNLPAAKKANLYLAKENAKDVGAAVGKRVKSGVGAAKSKAGYVAKDAGVAGKKAGKKVLKGIASGVGKVRRRVGFEIGDAGGDDAPAFVQFMQSQGEGSRDESKVKKIAGTAGLIGAGLLARKSIRSNGGVKAAGKKLIGGTKEIAGRASQRVTRPLRSRKMRKQATADAQAGLTSYSRGNQGGEKLDLARVDRLLTNLEALTQRG